MISSETIAEDEVMVHCSPMFPRATHLKLSTRDWWRMRRWGTRQQRVTADQVTLLLRICLQTTYFMYHQQFYEQTGGEAMGTPSHLW